MQSRTNNKIAIIFIGLLFSKVAVTAPLIVDADCDSKNSCVVISAGQHDSTKKPLQPFMVMNNGDKLELLGSAHVTLLNDDRSTVNITTANSPFIVEGVRKDETILNRVVAWWNSSSLLEKPMSEENTVSRGSDGNGDQACTFLGFNNSGSNYVSNQPNKLWLKWKHGHAPFVVSIFDASNNLLKQQETAGYETSFDSINFDADSNYTIRLTCSMMLAENLAAPVQEEVVITPTNEQDWAKLVADIKDLQISEKAKTRLIVASLAQMPEWRIQALQLAKDNQLDELVEKILIAP